MQPLPAWPGTGAKIMNDAEDRISPRRLYATLTIGALGVVYGDIGTSPLYAIREVFAGTSHAVPITPENILGVLSLFFWSLTIVVSIKYVLFIMRADNAGEGGIMALLAMVQRIFERHPQANRLVLLGLFGAALFFGDSVITPAISVFSALEVWKSAPVRSNLMSCPVRWRCWWRCSCSGAAAPAASAPGSDPL